MIMGKKMKRIGLLLVMITIIGVHTVIAQVVNTNFDSNSEPWITGGVMPIIRANNQSLVQELVLTQASLSTNLPDSVSNDWRKYFPPIFNQNTVNSCTQASEIAYVFTYEINRLRDVPAGNWKEENKHNLYYQHYTYNFLNDGENIGTYPYDGYDIVKSNGCPMYDDYYNANIPEHSLVYWMSGYEKYYNGMKNRVTEYRKIVFNNNYNKVNTLKHWIYDHNEGSNIGGIATICVYTDNWKPFGILPAESSNPNDNIITHLGTDPYSGHALTIVGYDDNICYDFNGDGIFTNDIDINGDGIVDLRDREYGAFKLANSWGDYFANRGFIWLPYRLLDNIMPIENNEKAAYVCYVEEYEPQITIKAKISFKERDKLQLVVGKSNNSQSSFPTDTLSYKIFNYQGGPNYMNGIDNNPLELGLDFGGCLGLNNIGKIFLIAKTKNMLNYNLSECFIKDFSIIDYRWDEVFQLDHTTTHQIIGNNSITTLGIGYDLLPFSFPSNYVCNSNKIGRRTIAVKSKLTVNNNVNIDLYGTDLHDCEIIVENNGQFVIGDSVNITAKRGHCKIEVIGDIIIGRNVNFSADDNSSLEIHFKNCNKNLYLNSANFNNCTVIFDAVDMVELADSAFIVINKNSDLIIRDTISFYGGNNSTLKIMGQFTQEKGSLLSYNNMKIEVVSNDFTIQSVIFNNSELMAEVESETTEENSITILNCEFINPDKFSAIRISNYSSYNIYNNLVDNCNGSGIQVYYCGNSASATMKNISNNTIENCNNAGLLVYASTGNITMNRISNNKMGVELLNNCNISNFNGNCAATNSSETQYIHGNDLYEVYMSSACNPQIFRYNIIEDNDSIPYLYYDGTIGFASSVQIPVRGQIDVTYNNWGSNFDADQHLFSNVTATEYLFYPEWELGDCSNATDSAKIIIARADSLVSEEKYEEAKTLYMQVVSDYPTTTSAETALKTMLPLEYYVENDYEGLQQYYLEEEEIVNDSVLLPLAMSLANKCDEEMGNYTDAINWYEGVITNPESTYNDSIFATIGARHIRSRGIMR